MGRNHPIDAVVSFQAELRAGWGMRRQTIKEKLGSRLCVWIDPSTVLDDIASKYPVTHPMFSLSKIVPVASRLERVAKGLEPFLIPNFVFRKRRPIVSIPKFERVRNLVSCGEHYKESIWYNHLLRRLKDNGVVRYKKRKIESVNDLDMFFETGPMDLMRSMAEHGYIVGKARDFGSGFVDRHGSIVKGYSGNHRFYMAKCLGLKRYPIEIGGINW